MIFDDKTIIACSSGLYQNYAVGLIRISGFKSIEILNKYFNKDLKNLKPRQASLCKVQTSKGDVLDEVVLTYFCAPNSYTGENTLEISVHGNQLSIARIIESFTEDSSIRLAQKGEFSYRALKNKKLNLSQVEGLDLLLNANSTLALDQGLNTLSGSLFDQYQELYKVYSKLRSSIELSIDFSEDIGEKQAKQELNKNFELFNDLTTQLHNRIIITGGDLINPEIVLLGETNAGKSSFFNTVLKNERAIVSNIKGTTRDSISELIQVKDFKFKLTDTAGIRETTDPIEVLGIERSKKAIGNAFYKALVLNPLIKNTDLMSEIDVDLAVITHIDLCDFSDLRVLLESLKSIRSNNFNVLVCSLEAGPIGPKLAYVGPIGPILNKIKNKSGPIGPKIDAKAFSSGPIGPEDTISSCFYSASYEKFQKITQSNPILIERHKTCINNIYLKTKELSELLSHNEEIGIIANRCEDIGYSIKELVGVVKPDDVLENIFSNFCIGK